MAGGSDRADFRADSGLNADFNPNDELMHWSHFIIIGITGACLGSFCSVLVCRIPAGQSFVTARSRCPGCHSTLKWYELVPLVSYIAQRGRCRTCEMPVSWLYPLRETVLAVICIVLLFLVGWSFELVKWILLATLLMAISEIDLRHGIVPNILVSAGIFIGAATLMIFDFQRLGSSLLAFFVTGAGLLLVRQGSIAFFGRPGLGMGDIKLIAMLALFVGWYSVWAFYLAAVIGGLAGLAGIAAGKITRSTHIPFAPFISLGVICSAFLYPVHVLAWIL